MSFDQRYINNNQYNKNSKRIILKLWPKNYKSLYVYIYM